MTKILNSAKIPVGTLATISIGSVTDIKALKVNENMWAFSSVPELGIDFSEAPNSRVKVQKVLDSYDDITPSRLPYNVDKMSGPQLEAALREILGDSGPDTECYSDYTGLNGFYHVLAGTYNNGYSKKVDEEPLYKVNTDEDGRVVITIPGLGDFVAIEHSVEFMAKTGDADSNIVFALNNRYFRKQGYLDSYEGGYWDGRLEEVRPVDRTVTFWESI